MLRNNNDRIRAVEAIDGEPSHYRLETVLFKIVLIFIPVWILLGQFSLLIDNDYFFLFIVSCFDLFQLDIETPIVAKIIAIDQTVAWGQRYVADGCFGGTVVVVFTGMYDFFC